AGADGGVPEAPRPARPRVAIRHVGRRLLVARGDESHALVAEPREGAIELHARQAKHDLDAFANQLSGERFTAGHPWHGLMLLFIGSPRTAGAPIPDSPPPSS